MALPFNRIVLHTDAGNPAELTVEQFNAMPLMERVRAALEKRVQFFDGDKPIAQGEALRALRERSR